MNIVVLCKQAPDTESKIKLLGDASNIDLEGIKWVLNPYDEYAVEEALKLKEAGKAAKVTVLSVGPKRSEEAIRTALAMGADDAVHVEDDSIYGADSFVVAKALANALKELDFGLILCGKQAVDDDMAAVPQMVAELLGIGQVTVIRKVEVEGDSITAHRDIEGGAKEVVQGAAPMILAATKGLNEPRYASLPGIMKAKRKPLAKKSLADVGVSAADAKTKIVAWTLPAPRQAGKIFKGTADDLAQRVAEVVKLLREEAKVV
ncbi:MAG: electron transfer flavoprotein subunit beta/FixA family protein [Candidatus Lernaella stagnicola]|nr:electron transfer flavoprotein subunit beta/FixA family protein [Candidatus Lernaella stagnicola]